MYNYNSQTNTSATNLSPSDMNSTMIFGADGGASRAKLTASSREASSSRAAHGSFPACY